MSTESNKQLVERMLSMIGAGDASGIENIVAPNWVNHDPSLPPMQGRAGARQLVSLFASAFTSMYFQIDDTVSEGDRVACRFRFGGVNTGSFMGAPVSGKKVEVQFRARVLTGRIATGEFSIDGGEWFLLFPADGIADSAQEDYRILTPELAVGEHLIGIRASDGDGNTGTSKLVVRIP